MFPFTVILGILMGSLAATELSLSSEQIEQLTEASDWQDG